MKETLKNEQIVLQEVRLIGPNSEQLGIMSSAKALEIAEDYDLDLVLMAPEAKPPVCKIMDYGKYHFEQMKREKEAKKNQKVIEIKEIRIIGTGIDDHDIDTKCNHIVRFLTSGNKVKITIRLRGREIGHPDQGFDVMEKIAIKCAECGIVEKAAKLEGRNMLMFLAPKSSK